MMRRCVAIIGGGVSGLAAAHHLRELAPEIDVRLLEARKRLGGVIQTTRQDGFLIESAADNFLTSSPAAVQLCQRLGLGDNLIGTRAEGRQAMVVCKGRLEKIPPGFLVMAPTRLWPLLTTPVLSALGKLRAGYEYFVPKKRDTEDESLQSFVCRRFGQEMFERLVQPLVGGIYTADPRRLSVAATMPRFLQMEREHGSLIRAMLRQRRGRPPEQTSGARYGQFAALRGGMSSLIEALSQQLPAESISLDSPVCSILPKQSAGWSIRVAGEHPSRLEADGVIVAAPAFRAAEMLGGVDANLADELRGIEYASCAVVSLAYRRDQIRHPLDAFGFVVPLAESRHILSCSFSSLKYEGRAPEGTVLLRVFIGGACQSGLNRLPKSQLVELAELELSTLLNIQGEPMMRHITRQTQAMPQYHVGHCQRIAAIDRRLQQFPSLAIAGSALTGVGVPGCIESGQAAAGRVLSALKNPTGLVSQTCSNAGVE
jgi:oxygen-dependent protoporphyrinogen oxidase